ncbi:acetate--CoA ligase [Dictyocaulus viviparus]|uniref:Acetyl-coenzyme A synthetase n=1 Tax=Dictyocaulus viviparus TaxID=29172 RepID=A0A0D8XPD6_DICVI|nr:acetate--CoA ligase [Dictyocaulus viviparus]
MSDVHVKFDITCTSEPEEEVFLPPAPLLAGAHVSGLQSYREKYRFSINNSDAFWKSIAEELHFAEGSSKGLEWNFDAKKGNIFCRFMDGAKTNISYNCLERNIKRGLGKKVAYIWEGNEPSDNFRITYNELHSQVVNFSAVLRAHGVQRGDVVALYLPMIPELAVAMLACTRIGEIELVLCILLFCLVFSAAALGSRIVDAKCRVMVTADGFFRGTKYINLKMIANEAVEIASKSGVGVESVIVVNHLRRITAPKGSVVPTEVLMRDIDSSYSAEMAKYKGVDSSVEWMDAESPLFLLYTSGSTGKPKGIQHSTAGYMVYAYFTTKCTFDVQPDKDIYWCTADCGWITGHTYLLYGPLLNGLTSVWFEGIPTYPTPDRFWKMIEKYEVSKFYTSPTAIRALMALGDDFVKNHSRSSLKIIGTVGEPINPTAWYWLYDVVGERRCAIVDTFWQTETGGHMITPLPGATPMKPGSATYPFFGVNPVILDADGRVIEGPGEGNLCFDRAWPGMLRTVFGDHDRFVKTYFSPFNGYYFTGDGARRDEDGYIWITGRVDDLMNVSGHLLSTAEIENALLAHEKGHFPYAFVTLNNGEKLSPSLFVELKDIVRTRIGAIAVPEVIQLAPGLPKTRSGKVTRRILRKIAEGCETGMGDITTLVDEEVIKDLVAGRIHG